MTLTGKYETDTFADAGLARFIANREGVAKLREEHGWSGECRVRFESCPISMIYPILFDRQNLNFLTSSSM